MTKYSQKKIEIMIKDCRTIRPNVCAPAGVKLRGSLIGTFSPGGAGAVGAVGVF